MMRLVVATTAGLLWAGAAFAQSGCGGPVVFAEGQNSATVGGRISGGSTCDFTLRGETGQRLTAEVASQGTVSAEVIAPVRQSLSGQAFVLPENGEYTVRLLQSAAAAAEGQAPQFTVTLRLSGVAASPPPAAAATVSAVRPAARPQAPDSAAATAPETRPAAVEASRPRAKPVSPATAPATPPATAPAAEAPAPAPAPTQTAAPAAQGNAETHCIAAEQLDRDAYAIAGRIAGGGTCDYTVTAAAGQALTLVMPRSEGFQVRVISPTEATLTPDQPQALTQPGPQTVRITRTGSGAADFVARLRLDATRQ